MVRKRRELKKHDRARRDHVIQRQRSPPPIFPELGTSDEKPASSFRFPSFKAATDAYHREFILHKLAEFEGNVSKAARRWESIGVICIGECGIWE
jgi:hypothetical protein